MALVRVGGVNFNIEVEGPPKAPFVILSNSLGTNFHMWDPQMAELTRHFRVIRYDSRGHGRSHADDGPYSIASLGRDALAILDALGVSKTHWVGLSMGGMVGQWLLANAPNRMERAVLANTGAYLGSSDLWNTRIRTALATGMATLSNTTVDRWFTKDFQNRNPGVIAKILAMLNATPPQGYAASCAAIRDMDQRESIRAIQKPVLVIVGRYDPATPPAMGKLIAASIPDSQIITLEAAHLSNIEDAETFTKSIVDFLTGKEVTRPKLAPRKAAIRVAAKSATEKTATAAKSIEEPAARVANSKTKASKAKASQTKVSKTKSPNGKAASKPKKPATKTAAKKSPAKKSAAKSPAKKTGRKTLAKKPAKAPAKKSVRKPAPKKSATKTRKSR